MHSISADQIDYVACLKASKGSVVDGTALSTSLVPSYLLRSWQRSFGHGVRITDKMLQCSNYQQYLIDDTDRHLSAVVGEEIDAIWDSFGGEHWAVYCTNTQGLIIRARHGTNPMSRSFALHVGRRIQESDIGTNAPACALEEKKPITLVGDEHYLDEFVDHFCCAVPLWGPWGTIVGVINITGNEAFKSRLVEKKMVTAAVKIENRLFLESHSTNTVFKIHYDGDFIDTHLAGLVAINEFGDILSMTRNALEMLENIDPFNKRCNVADLFDDEIVVVDGYCLKSSLKNGIVFYTKAYSEGLAGTLINNVATRSSGSVRHLSELHILETMRRSGGNISKAAKVLGLSRTTLYRLINKQPKDPGTD